MHSKQTGVRHLRVHARSIVAEPLRSAPVRKVASGRLSPRASLVVRVACVASQSSVARRILRTLVLCPRLISQLARTSYENSLRYQSANLLILDTECVGG